MTTQEFLKKMNNLNDLRRDAIVEYNNDGTPPKERYATLLNVAATDITVAFNVLKGLNPEMAMRLAELLTMEDATNQKDFEKLLKEVAKPVRVSYIE